eukprot:CAMPEP_0167760802 /NCGR_PEP_ID=MMETSP0110_2-20121227/11791_1 /TAXON_ID=629695 /ORGANISM="Gymnochlora sp., Strain CCMP2014" /LENGTH=879 /DNA_ID=CAMNT_0007647359 /DNA_START=611 /DNA_END=3250 /DNA_ORIENTATION=-
MEIQVRYRQTLAPFAHFLPLGPLGGTIDTERQMRLHEHKKYENKPSDPSLNDSIGFRNKGNTVDPGSSTRRWSDLPPSHRSTLADMPALVGMIGAIKAEMEHVHENLRPIFDILEWKSFLVSASIIPLILVSSGYVPSQIVPLIPLIALLGLMLYNLRKRNSLEDQIQYLPFPLSGQSPLPAIFRCDEYNAGNIVMVKEATEIHMTGRSVPGPLGYGATFAMGGPVLEVSIKKGGSVDKRHGSHTGTEGVDFGFQENYIWVSPSFHAHLEVHYLRIHNPAAPRHANLLWIQSILESIVIIVERLESLIVWRDPVKSSIASATILSFLLLIYFIPLNQLLTIWLFLEFSQHLWRRCFCRSSRVARERLLSERKDRRQRIKSKDIAGPLSFLVLNLAKNFLYRVPMRIDLYANEHTLPRTSSKMWHAQGHTFKAKVFGGIEKKNSKEDLVFPIPEEGRKPLNDYEILMLRNLRQRYDGKDKRISDDYCLQFIRGYAMEKKNREKQTLEKFGVMLQNREELKMDTILTRQPDGWEHFNRAFPTGILGQTLSGRPVYYERMGLYEPKDFKELGLRRLKECHARMQEEIRVRKEILTSKRGHLLLQHMVVLDLAGFSWQKHAFGEPLSMVRKMMAFDNDQFPFSFSQLLIINAPWIFYTLWNTLSIWIHPYTKSKIKIIRANRDETLKILCKYIDISQVPTWLGGENEGKLNGICSEDFEKLLSENKKSGSAIETRSTTMSAIHSIRGATIIGTDESREITRMESKNSVGHRNYSSRTARINRRKESEPATNTRERVASSIVSDGRRMSFKENELRLADRPPLRILSVKPNGSPGTEGTEGDISDLVASIQTPVAANSKNGIFDTPLLEDEPVRISSLDTKEIG